MSYLNHSRRVIMARMIFVKILDGEQSSGLLYTCVVVVVFVRWKIFSDVFIIITSQQLLCLFRSFPFCSTSRYLLYLLITLTMAYFFSIKMKEYLHYLVNSLIEEINVELSSYRRIILQNRQRSSSNKDNGRCFFWTLSRSHCESI